MATRTIGKMPELTVDEAMTLFSQGLGGRYQVTKPTVLNRDFMIRKNDWVGVGVQLKQGQNGTTFVFTGVIPNTTLLLLFGVSSYLFLRSSFLQMESEVAEFIAKCPRFKAKATAPRSRATQPAKLRVVKPRASASRNGRVRKTRSTGRSRTPQKRRAA